MDEIIPEDFNEEEPKWRKPLIISIAAFLIVLIATYTLFSLGNILGLLESKKVENNQLITKDIKIVFQNSTLEKIQEEYFSNQHREIKACLFGSVENKVYKINNVIFPEIIRANVIHIVSPRCKEGTLIDFHSHPWHSCSASDQDLSVFKELKPINPDLLMVVMCATNRFSIYT